jgi:nicotinate-nucleotide pyrophosphorylase
MAEEILMGLMAKPSGIATNTHKFVKAIKNQRLFVVLEEDASSLKER